MQRNYQRELDLLIEQEQKKSEKRRVLLHSCCAPCSSYVMWYLSQYFAVTVFYYNPNIAPEEEYRARISEQERLIREMPFSDPVGFIAGDYNPSVFYEVCKGMEFLPEGGERCRRCFALRLRETARVAAEQGFDYFTTTLSISPLKNAAVLQEEAEKAAAEFGVPCLPSDFKKRNGYQMSIAFSKEYGLYRQNYCGCIFSKRDSQEVEK